MPMTEIEKKLADLLVLKVKRDLEKKKSENSINQEEMSRLRLELDFVLQRPSLVKDILNLLRDKVSGTVNKPNSYLCLFLGITSKMPDMNRGFDFKFVIRKDSSRVSPPDIDIDFEHRELILQHLCDLYGKEKVALIGVDIRMKPKAAVQFAAKVLDIMHVAKEGDKKFQPENDQEAKRISKIMLNIPNVTLKQWLGEDPKYKAPSKAIETAIGLMKEEKKKYPEVFELASRLEGILKSYGTHAAGVVISAGSLTDDIPLHTAKMQSDENDSFDFGLDEEVSEDWMTTQFDMKDVESIGLLKFDFLQLSNLRQMTMMEQLIKERNGGKLDFDLDNLDIYQPEVFKTIDDCKLEGLFQISGKAFMGKDFPVMDRITKQPILNKNGTVKMKHYEGMIEVIGCQNFEDIVVANALGRPGPLNLGMHTKYAEGKKNPSSVTYLNPKLEPILKTTYGNICYQEQLISMAMLIAGFTFAEADKLRKACAKKDKELLDKIEPLFRQGCSKNGIKDAVTEELWEVAVRFGEYAFNRTLYFKEGISTEYGEYTIGELFLLKKENKKLPRVYSEYGHLIDIVDVYDHGVLPMYKVSLSDGSTVTCTMNHKFETDIGVIPLWTIIRKNAHIMKNMGACKNGYDKRVCVRGMQGNSIDSKWVKDSQKDLRRLGQKEEGELPESKYNQQQEICTAICRRPGKKREVEEKTFFHNIGGHYVKSEGKSKKKQAIQRIERKIQRQLSGEQNKNCDRNVITFRNFGSKISCSEKMERFESRRIFSEMHTEINGRSKVEIETREVSAGDLTATGIQILSSCEKRKLQNKIQKETNRFFGQKSNDNSRIRWGTAFQEIGMVRGYSSGINGEGQGVGGRNVQERLSRVENILRYMATSSPEIQIQSDSKFDEMDRIGSKVHDSENREKVSIEKVEFIGEVQGYDIEVDSKEHLYCLSSGLVNSNSHSVAYGLITLQTAYLKTFYTTEFICAILTYAAQKNDEKLEATIVNFQKEYPKLEILPPDINKSRNMYVPMNDFKIVAPFVSIKGIGLRVSEAIVNGQPYSGVIDFMLKTKSVVDSRTIESLLNMDAFRAFGTKESVSKDIQRHDRIVRVAAKVSKADQYKTIDLF